jgi:flagellin-like protein
MKKRSSNSKRALSPVIATILLIALVLIIAALIFLWATGLIREQIQKNDQAIQNLCPSVNLQIAFFRNSTGGHIEVINRGIVNVHNLEIKRAGRGEKININSGDNPVGVGESIVFLIDNSHLSVNTNQLIVYPILLGTIKSGRVNKEYTCHEHGKVLDVYT